MDSLVLMAGALLAIPLTLIWIVIHIVGAVRLGGALGAISQKAKIAWALGVVGGFMGPCVILLSMVSMVLAVVAQREPEVTPETLQATRTVLLAGATILLMAAVLGAAVLGSQLLAPASY